MWAKFGQMAGKALSKLKPRKGLRARPKSLKTMENIANKSKPIVNKIKSYGAKAKGVAKKIKDSSLLPATGFGLGAAGGFGAAGAVSYLVGYNKGKKDSNKKKKKYKTTDLDLGKYNYKITSYK